jgi:hypothetical protein
VIYVSENEQMSLFEDEPIVEQTDDLATEELKEAMNEQFTKIQNQAMVLGIRVASKMVLDKIAVAMSKPGKRSLNDYKRLIKEIEDFCNVAMTQKSKEEEESVC